MHALSDASLISLWEQAAALSHGARARALLQSGGAGLGPGEVAALTVGERDARLLSLRAETFGDAMACIEDCPACCERLEFTVSAQALLATMPRRLPPHAEVALGARRLRLRLPTVGDVDLAAAAGPGEGAATLLARCLLDPLPAGTVAPQELWAAAESALAAADPLADPRLSLACEACNERWEATFDIVEYLWCECAAAAQRLLGEVHALALSYHWSERDILALGPLRRRFYLECLGA